MADRSCTAEQLQTAFLNAVRARELERCAEVLDELAELAVQEPGLAPWVRYFEGILANERDHDWAAAERIFLGVLADGAGIELGLHARLLLALALTYRREGRLQECIAMCERSLPVYAALDDAVGQAKALKQIVIACTAGYDQSVFGGDIVPQALAYCRRALALLENQPPATEITWLQGTLWCEIGALHRIKQEWNDAIAAYQRYMAMSQELHYPFDEGLAAGNLGEVYLQLGPERWPEALTAFEKARQVAHSFDVPSHELEALANLAYLHQRLGDLEGALACLVEAAALVSTLRAGMSSDLARAGFIATVTETLANAVLAALAVGRSDLAFDLGEQARARSLLDMVTAEPAGMDAWAAAETLSLAQVQQTLAPGDVLFSYFTTGLQETPDAGGDAVRSSARHRFPPPATLLFAVTCEGIRVVDTGVNPNDLLPRRLKSAAERHFLRPVLLRTLYDRLVAPAAPLLADRSRLFLAPHGPLHYVPFPALTDPAGVPLLWKEGPEVVFGPSASVLLRPRAEPLCGVLPAGDDSRPCLAVGSNGDKPHPLRFAEEEAQAIAALLEGDAVTGPQATREALLRLAPTAAILHFSCHGEFDPHDPMASRLHLAGGETLTAHETLQLLRLRCRLVTLSACESGLSLVQRGDELFGLIRAFMGAGASAVVASLWRVDERSTRILMERFYSEIAQGCTFAQALKRAQIYLRGMTREEAVKHLGGGDVGAGERPFADPFYWAAFILAGAG